MDTLHTDFETRSVLDLPVVGLDNYIHHPTTQVLLQSWAINDQKIKLWEPHKGPMPAELREAVLDPWVRKCAWNTMFERTVLRVLLGLPTEYEEWFDPMANARYLSLPGPLEDAGEILGLGASAKLKVYSSGIFGLVDPQQQRLVTKFCVPARVGGEDTLFGTSAPIFRDWETDPEDWEMFGKYCCRDTEAEREALKKMRRFPLPDQEQLLWVLDQKINDRGIPVDMVLVEGAIALAERAQSELRARLQMLTGVENPNSRDQMLLWLKTQGYPFASVGKDFVNRALAGEGDMSAEGREALLLRKQAAKTSYVKYERIKELISADGRLRHQFVFMGASRTARWSGRDVQFQNLARPIKLVEKNLDAVLADIRAVDFERVSRRGDVVDIVGSCIRSAFHAPPGKKLVVCDLNAIEGRGGGWLTRCQKILSIFEENRDPYVSFAVYMYEQPYDELYAEYQAGNKEKRNGAKPGFLGAQYGLSGGEESVDKDGNPVKTGLWAYAENMGVDLSQEMAHHAVKVFRETYPEVVQMWYALESAAIRTISTGKPQREGRVWQRDIGEAVMVPVDPVYFDMVGKTLRMVLPSGRALHYVNARLEDREFFGRTKKTIVYDGIDHTDKQSHAWGPTVTRGAKLFENEVQAICRDLLAHGMLLADKVGFEIVAHVHDEIVCLVDEGSPLGLEDLRNCMVDRPAWGVYTLGGKTWELPLGADGYTGLVYRKG